MLGFFLCDLAFAVLSLYVSASSLVVPRAGGIRAASRFSVLSIIGSTIEEEHFTGFLKVCTIIRSVSWVG